MAAAISYHLLFSVFPLAIAAVGVLGVFMHDEEARTTVADAVVRLVPLSDQGQHQLHNLLQSVSGGSGLLGLLGLLGVLWSASGVMAAMRVALTVAWDTQQRRPFFKGKAVDVLLIGVTFVVVAVALGLTLLGSLARRGDQQLPGVVRTFTGPILTIVSIAAATALLFVVFVFLYWFVPGISSRVRDIWPGAAVAAIGFELVQYGFSVYVSHFAHYNRVYGSLGAVVAFLFFVYLSSSVFLFGAEVASEYPQFRHADKA